MAGERPYTVEASEMVAETPELRMVVLTLASGQEVPWHWHSEVADLPGPEAHSLTPRRLPRDRRACQCRRRT